MINTDKLEELRWEILKARNKKYLHMDLPTVVRTLFFKPDDGMAGKTIG